MKKRSTAFIIALICMTLTGCDSKEQNTDIGSKISESTASSASDLMTGNSEMSSEVSETSEISEENSAVKVMLSGDPNDAFIAETDCYAENDDVVMYFQKGVTVKGDMLEITNKAMNDLSETSGLSFDGNYGTDDVYQYIRDTMNQYYEPNIFDKVNSDESKINILVVNIGDISEWADGNSAILDQSDFDYDNCNYDILYHELSHVLQFRNGVNLGSVMDEGFAAYMENKTRLSHNIPAWDAAQYYFPLEFDESLISGEEETFAYMFDDTETNYQYGFRFLTFLYENYGDDIYADILSEATQSGFSTSYNEDDAETSIKENSQKLLKIIKSVTSENVLNEFDQWYNDNWNVLGEEYMQQVSSME